MPTTSDTILAALSATGLWGKMLKERVPSEGLLIQRDGKPGEPEVALSPLAHHCLHRSEIEPAGLGASRDAAFGALCASIGFGVAAVRTLGSLSDQVEAEAQRPVDLPVGGAAKLKAAVTPVVIHHSTAHSLGLTQRSARRRRSTGRQSSATVV